MTLCRMLVSAAALLVGSAMAAAQVPQNGVNGTGTATFRGSANTVRVAAEISAEGKDAREAAARLKEKRDALRAKLIKLGAPEGSIEVGPPLIGSSVSGRQQEMERMLRSRMARSPRAPATAPTPTVVLSTLVKAEWKLAEGPADDMVVAATELADRIKAADLPDVKNAKVATADAEMREEMEAMMGREEAPPPPLQITYVRKLTADERQKLAAEAFAKAKAAAALLASAAGRELGPLQSLAARDIQEPQYPDYGPYPYSRRRFEVPGEMVEGEATGEQPTQVQFIYYVNAAFNVK